MTKRTSDISQDTAEGEAAQTRRRTKRKPGRIVNEIYRLHEDDEPEYLDAPPEHVDVRRFVKRTHGPGDYLVITKEGGRFKAQQELHIDPTPEDVTAATPADDEDELDAPTLEAPDLSKLAAAILDEQERRTRASQAAQPDPLAYLEKINEMAERRAESERKMRAAILAEIEASRPKENPAQAQPQLDAETQLGVLLLKNSGAMKGIFRNAREAFGAVEKADEPLTWTEKLAGIAEAYAPYVGPYVGPVIGPVVGQLFARAAMQQSGAAEQSPAPTQSPQQTAAQPSGPQPAPTADAQAAALAVLNVAVSDLKRNKRVGRTADAIDELVTAHPSLGGEVAGLLTMPPSQVLAQLSQVAGEDLAAYSHAHEWIETLAAEVLPEAEEDEGNSTAETPTGTNNGHVASTGAGVTM